MRETVKPIPEHSTAQLSHASNTWKKNSPAYRPDSSCSCQRQALAKVETSELGGFTFGRGWAVDAATGEHHLAAVAAVEMNGDSHDDCVAVPRHGQAWVVFLLILLNLISHRFLVRSRSLARAESSNETRRTKSAIADERGFKKCPVALIVIGNSQCFCCSLITIEEPSRSVFEFLGIRNLSRPRRVIHRNRNPALDCASGCIFELTSQSANHPTSWWEPLFQGSAPDVGSYYVGYP
jgi:hypothetical protein